MPRASTKTSFDVDPQVRQPFNMDDLMQGGPEIEAIPAEADIKSIMETEQFMNEMLVIRFLDSGDPNAPKLIEIGVNTAGHDGRQGGKSTRMGFERGVKYSIPRYMFEAIAHSKRTTLEQVRDPRDPMSIMHVERHAFSYPFECLSDPNPKGQSWRDKVMSDPA